MTVYNSRQNYCPQNVSHQNDSKQNETLQNVLNDKYFFRLADFGAPTAPWCQCYKTFSFVNDIPIE